VAVPEFVQPKRKGMKSMTLHLHGKVWNDLTKERWSYASCGNFFTRALMCGLDLDASKLDMSETHK
jgi:hypothetical protein